MDGSGATAGAIDPPVSLIGLDGDDTLWHNESIFAATSERFRALVGRYVPDTAIDERLLATERRNIALFGYGVKGYALSLIETAIELTGGRVDASDLAAIVDWAKDMLAHPVELLDSAADAVRRLADVYPLALITKGDFFHQESKIARSGLADLFSSIEIVPEKEPATYRAILERAGTEPRSFVMVGNSLRSDVLPVVEIGGQAVHIPYAMTWQHEQVAGHERDGRFVRIADIGQLPDLLLR